MRYERTLAVICGGCEKRLTIEDGTMLTRTQWDGRLHQVVAVAFPAGEGGQPIPVQSAMRFALESGWSMLTDRDIESRFRTILRVEDLDGAEARGLTAVCPECAGTVMPPFTKSARRALDEAAEADRSTLDRIARLEAQVSALTGLRDAVAS